MRTQLQQGAGMWLCSQAGWLAEAIRHRVFDAQNSFGAGFCPAGIVLPKEGGLLNICISLNSALWRDCDSLQVSSKVGCVKVSYIGTKIGRRRKEREGVVMILYFCQ